MSILITGAGGMVGSHLIDYYSAKGMTPSEIIGSYFKPTTDISEVQDKATLIECDVRYFQGVQDLILKYKPEKIFHLAAQSYPTVSWQRPTETMDVNVNGTINVFEAIKVLRNMEKDYDPVVVVACSSAEYGASLTPENTPVKEETTLLPMHPYGVSKVSQDLLSFQYHFNDKIRSIRARIFNTTGPRKVNDVMADFTQRAVQIERGELDKLRVGNIETRRAITDVRDLIIALVLLSEKGKWGEVYNISGQKAYLIKDLIPIIKKEIGKDFGLFVDPVLLRPSDEPIIYGDASRLINDTEWKQQYSIEQTIVDMINYWRGKL